ncbi:DEAD/DEAH box helicase [Burkholderia contaminans]|uniref:Helicase SNF2 n=1 Tax=Burkholderia contaminans TaxID=488447 RepID=A0A2S5DMD7_9BURK|nr:DEAD/DEAH box helicase [Burkholderia contaminans]POZ80245.1 helicase SNF2 [Burkholderia contaminans]
MSFGKIDRVDGRWRISCEPHVRTKLKRLFPEVNQHAGEFVWLSDNDENCRDLLWFIDRYPMSVDALERLQRGAANHVEEESAVAELLENRSPPSEFALREPARVYQLTAATLATIKGGLLVADDVGLGKTVTGICPMTKPDHLPALVVTLTHLPGQWASELARFAPELKIHVLKSGKPYDLLGKRDRRQASLFEAPRLPDVIISNYHKLNGWAETLAGVVRYVVFDEVQELRRDDSAKYAAAKHIAAKAQLSIGLSATPIYNYGEEFFNVIDIVRPGVLGSREEFLREWCGAGNDGRRILDPRAFGAHLRREGIMLRRTRAEVGRQLPALSKIPQSIEADRAALERIKGSAVELAKVILASQQQSRGEKFLASEEFNVLMRQATGIAKAPYVAEFVRLLVESGEQVVLYGWHREVYGIWLEQLSAWNPMLYTGTETPTQKDAAKDAFVRGECRILIISLRAGAGLDGLQHHCKTVVFGELDWSPGVHEQCIGRVYRDGQTEPVMAHYLISDDGADPIMADVLGVKRGQIEGVRDTNVELVEQLDVEAGSMKRLAESYLKRVGVDIEVVEQTAD